MKPVSLELGSLINADGSAKWSQEGSSSVLVGVHGPAPCPHRQELYDRALVVVEVQPLNSAPSLKETAMGQELKSVLESVILSSLHPRSQIQIIIQPIMRMDSSFMAVAVNACMVALMEAGVPLSKPLAAISSDDVGFGDDDVTWTMVCDPQGTPVYFKSIGRLAASSLSEIKALGSSGCQQVHEFIRTSMQQRSEETNTFK